MSLPAVESMPTRFQQHLMRFALDHGGGEANWFRGGMAATLTSGDTATRIDPASEADLKSLANGEWILLTDLRPGESRPPIEYRFRLTPTGFAIAANLSLPLIDFAVVGATGAGEPDNPSVIGQQVADDWWATVPKSIPPMVRVAVARAHACELLRQIRDELESVVPEASGLERRMLKFLVSRPIDDIIDMLDSPELVDAWDSNGPRLAGLVNLLVVASKVISNAVGWADALAYIQKAIEILRSRV